MSEKKQSPSQATETSQLDKLRNRPRLRLQPRRLSPPSLLGRFALGPPDLATKGFAPRRLQPMPAQPAQPAVTAAQLAMGLVLPTTEKIPEAISSPSITPAAPFSSTAPFPSTARSLVTDPECASSRPPVPPVVIPITIPVTVPVTILAAPTPKQLHMPPSSHGPWLSAMSAALAVLLGLALLCVCAAALHLVPGLQWAHLLLVLPLPVTALSFALSVLPWSPWGGGRHGAGPHKATGKRRPWLDAGEGLDDAVGGKDSGFQVVRPEPPLRM